VDFEHVEPIMWAASDFPGVFIGFLASEMKYHGSFMNDSG
jgi:hypothetical protein